MSVEFFIRIAGMLVLAIGGIYLGVYLSRLASGPAQVWASARHPGLPSATVIASDAGTHGSAASTSRSPSCARGAISRPSSSRGAVRSALS